MRYPTLPGRSKKWSQQDCTEFRGILRRPVGVLGRWWDARNLTAARMPRMAVRPARSRPQTLDGNTLKNPIIAMCGGEHPVLLDSMGFLRCNGQSISLGTIAGTYYCPHYSWTVSYADQAGVVSVDPERGEHTATTGYTDLPYMDSSDAGPRTVKLKWDDVNQKWLTDLSGSWAEIVPTVTQDEDQNDVQTFTELGVTVTQNYSIDNGWTITITASAETAFTYGNIRMVRMGANVLLYRPNSGPFAWVNTEKLATGYPMQADDYGTPVADLGSAGTGLTLTMCREDGTAFDGVVVSATEPAHEGYWLDTSGSELALREWAASSSMWVSVSSTFVMVETMDVTAVTQLETGSVKTGDTVQIYNTLPEGTDAAYTELLDGAHYLYGVTGPDANGHGSIIISGIIPEATKTFNSGKCFLSRQPPIMDFIVECGNRLWGCKYGYDPQTGESINEIYASKLGDFTNWEVYQQLSTDAWRASRGVPAPFTGAAVLDGCPLFFREESLEKVYPSSSGAHQIKTFDLEGVEEGAADSLVVIEDRMYYKSRQGVMVYTGTVPQRISEALGDQVFRGGSAARHGRKYCLATTRKGSTDELVVLVYDLDSGDWQIETEGWEELAVTWKDELYYTDEEKKLTTMAGSGSADVEWYAETGTLTYVTEHKWISYLRVRAALETDAVCKAYVQYDKGAWVLAGQLSGTTLGMTELVIFPRRHDSLRLRFEGTGGCEIQSIAYRLEPASGGH